ncbi:MAG: hypothetical protein Q9227_001023 [Pyrenula ochraceoflavens]
MILKDIMRGLNRGRAPSEILRPYQVFDLIGGTSTGGSVKLLHSLFDSLTMVLIGRILAIMLGRLRMSVEECEAAYLSMSERIFNPKRGAANIIGRAHDAWKMEGRFDSNELNAAIWEILDEQGFCTEELLQDPCNECKVFVCAVLTSNTTACVLRSYPNDDSVELLYDSCTIWEACRATSAATSFFDPIAIGPYDQSFADGAIMYNNPIQLVYREAEMLWPCRVQDAILISLGTGSAPSPALEGNIVKVVQALKDIVIQAESASDDFFSDHKRMADNEQLYRFNVYHGLGEIGLEEYKEKRRIADATHAYLTNAETRQRWRKCVQKLGMEEQPRIFPVVAANMSLPVRPSERKSPPVSPQPGLALHQTSDSAYALLPEGGTQTPNTSAVQVDPLFHTSVAESIGVPEISAEHVEDPNLRLVHAVKMINLPEVHEAIKSGANVSFDKNRPLAIAAAIGEIEIVSALVQNGGEVNEPDENGKSPLITAVTNKHFSTAKYLIESGANVNATDQLKNTALHLTCIIGNQPLVKMLLENGANPLLQNFNSDIDVPITPMHDAAQYSPNSAVRRTPIHEAAKHNHPNAVEILLEAGVDIGIQDSRGRTPFETAVLHQSPESVQVLLNKGAEIEPFGSSGVSALHIACIGGNEKTVELLINHGANTEVVHTADFRGVVHTVLIKGTALFFACLYGHERVVKLLTERGANMEYSSPMKNTLLHVAAFGRDSESSGNIVTFLLSKGLAANKKDKNGQTAREIARDRKNNAVMQAFREHDAALRLANGKENKSRFRRMFS